MANVLFGVWTYRSFYNKTDSVKTLNDLLLAEGQIVFETAADGAIRGELTFPGSDARLTLVGSLQTGVPTTARFQGVGDDSTSAKGWIYDYLCYLVPSWPNGQGQVAALVGSVIRTVPHAGSGGTIRPAGAVYSFVAVNRGFVEPREVIPLPGYIIQMQASRHHRLHHLIWHSVRNSWLELRSDQVRAITKLGWNPPRPAKRPQSQIDDGSETLPVIDNGSGEDFLFMHRQMVSEVKKMMQQHRHKPIQGWYEIPEPTSLVDSGYPGNPDGFAVPPTYFISDDEQTNRRLQALKSDKYFWTRLHWWDRQFKNPHYLRTLTLGELGSLIEFSVHNDMHMRWSSLTYDPVLGTPVPGGRVGGDIATKWDLPTYDYLGDFYSSHVNPVFWRLHGWVDKRIDDWFAAHEQAHPGQVTERPLGGVTWFEVGRWVRQPDPWSGPAMMASTGMMKMSSAGRKKVTKSRTSAAGNDDPVKVMEKVVAILYGQPARPAAPAARRKRVSHRHRRTRF